jgi:hypothetical protein
MDLIADEFHKGVEVGTSPNSASVRYVGSRLEESADPVDEVIELTVRWTTDISLGMLAAWLYETFRGRARGRTGTLFNEERTERRVIDFDDQGTIRRVLEEKVTRRHLERLGVECPCHPTTSHRCGTVLPRHGPQPDLDSLAGWLFTNSRAADVSSPLDRALKC